MAEDNELTLGEIRERYRPRLIDGVVERSLSLFGGVQIVGPKWCGKSWTGINHSRSAIFLIKEEIKRYAELDPDGALKGEYPRLIDEWQEVPKLWDNARMKIDFSSRRGLFIFAGSTTPPKNSVSHSGAGRFICLKMHTMSLYESGDSNGKVSLSGLFNDKEVEAIRSQMDYQKIIQLLCKGGWPESIEANETDSARIPKAYLDIISHNDTSKIDGRKRDPKLMRKLLWSIARNTATSASMNVLSKDMAEKGERPSETTVKDYLIVLKEQFLIEEQRGWSPNLRSATRIQSSPRRHLTDPSLAAAMLCNGPGELIYDPKTAGFLFESLCYRDLCIYVMLTGGEIMYYRDENGLEVDFIIQLDDGRWGMAEAKMGYNEFEKATHNMLRLRDKMVAGGVREPSFMIILNVTGGLAIKREDGIVEVPIDCLGP